MEPVEFLSPVCSSDGLFVASGLLLDFSVACPSISLGFVFESASSGLLLTIRVQ